MMDGNGQGCWDGKVWRICRKRAEVERIEEEVVHYMDGGEWGIHVNMGNKLAEMGRRWRMSTEHAVGEERNNKEDDGQGHFVPFQDREKAFSSEMVLREDGGGG
jgi:hypothetical protein